MVLSLSIRQERAKKLATWGYIFGLPGFLVMFFFTMPVYSTFVAPFLLLLSPIVFLTGGFLTGILLATYIFGLIFPRFYVARIETASPRRMTVLLFLNGVFMLLGIFGSILFFYAGVSLLSSPRPSGARFQRSSATGPARLPWEEDN